MDHAEADESDGHPPQDEVADGPPVRGNSTKPTSKSMADGDDASGGEGAAAAPDKGAEAMDVDSDNVAESTDGVSTDGGASSAANEAPKDTAAPMDATTTDEDDGEGADQAAEQPESGVPDAAQSESETEKPTNGGASSQGPGGVSAVSADGQDVIEAEASEAQLPSAPVESLVTEASMSFDDRSTDNLSDRASSADGEQSESETIPGSSAVKDSERAPLVDLYGPFIHPTDTCLADARERLHVALEQTRLLRMSFTDQAYERYLCIMKPVPETLEEIIEPIQSDPAQAGASLREKMEVIKAEKHTEKKQAQKAGVGLEEIAYFGEGLHLVVLPEDEVDEEEIDITQFPYRGPTDPETGERCEDISAAATTTTEQVFDRIRRIRAFRMGGELLPPSVPDVPPQLSRTPAQGLSPGFPVVPPAASPAPSTDSDASEGDQQLQHLLTLAPDAEGTRADGTYTAVQAALMARGVGMNEMRRDFRINPLRQRMVQHNYFAPTPSYKMLPPLLGPQQLYRLRASDARKEDLGVRVSARESIKSVVEEICSAVDKGKYSNEDDNKKVGSSGSGSKTGIRRALGFKHGAVEIDLLHHMRLAMHQNSKGTSIPVASESEPRAAAESNPDTDKSEFDPILAFSVMKAVGLVRNEGANEKNRETSTSRKPRNAQAHALGLDGLTDLETVAKFFPPNASTGKGKKRPLPDQDGPKNEAKLPKLESEKGENGNLKADGVQHIRGGGGQDETEAIKSNPMPEIGEKRNEKKNGVSPKTKKKSDAAMPGPSLAGYPSFDPLHRAMPQVPLGDKQSQNMLAAAASRQLLQHQFGIHPDPYHAATLAQQLTAPIGPPLSSLPVSDLSEFYLRNGNPDWSAARPDALAQQLRLLPGHIKLTASEQEAARALLLQDHHNAATARAHGAVTAAAAARYQAAMSSINPQNPFGFAASINQLRSNAAQPISSTLARKRSMSLSESPTHSKKNDKQAGVEESNQAFDAKRPASAPPSPPSQELDGATMRVVSHDNISTAERSVAIPPPPKGLRKDMADLVAAAKFHEAHSISTTKPEESEAYLIDFLLSLGAALPIPKQFIADTLKKRLNSPNFQFRLHKFAGSSSFASSSREVIVAIISIWLWTEHKDCLKEFIVESGTRASDPDYKWLITVAIDKCLLALAAFFDSRALGKNDGAANETPNEQVAAIASQSLVQKVFIDSRADSTFPAMDDLLKLLDSLRTDALHVKIQERVLLAALASRCGNMTEAFSNAYVSSIVRAGVALGHENVCEIGQDEECRASTMLPYDFFHDNVGVWEEPCRPPTGYHLAVGGDELMKQAHARSVFQKSLKRLQTRHRLKGGVTDGGPYYLPSSKKASAPSTPSSAPPLLRTPSGSLKRRGSFDSVGASGTGTSGTVFDPDHNVMPMLWNPKDVANTPYGQHEVAVMPSAKKKAKLSHGDHAASSAIPYRSTDEIEWEEVANMFFHGGSTRSIDVDYDFAGNDTLGKKKIIAPFVRDFDQTALESVAEADDKESSSDEDVSDEAVLQRHQEVLREMKLKLDAALESKKQSQAQPPQQRVRKR